MKKQKTTDVFDYLLNEWIRINHPERSKKGFITYDDYKSQCFYNYVQGAIDSMFYSGMISSEESHVLKEKYSERAKELGIW